MGLVSLWIPFLNERIRIFWFTMPNFIYLSLIPVLTIFTLFRLLSTLYKNKEFQPFCYSVLLFILGYLGLILSIWPFIVPSNISVASGSGSGSRITISNVGRSGNTFTNNIGLYNLLLLYIPWKINLSPYVLIS